MSDNARIREILTDVKRLAAEYYRLSGKPLGVTGEVGEHLVAEALGLQLMPARTAGFDGTRDVGDHRERIQIKARAYPSGPDKGQRMPKVDIAAACDTVMLAILDNSTLDLREVWEAPMADYRGCSSKLSPKEQDRGMKVLTFKSFAQRVWPRGP